MSAADAALLIFKLAETIGPEIVEGIAGVFSAKRPDLLPDSLPPAGEGARRAAEIRGSDDDVIAQRFPKESTR